MKGGSISDPAATVIIPAFNSAEFIGTALKSVAAQTFRDFEVIVVDDESSDATVEVAGRVLRELALQGHVVTRPPRFRKGAGGARNAGAAMARGAILAFLDSDDEWTPDHLLRAVDALRPGAGTAVAYCATAAIPSSGPVRCQPYEGYPFQGVGDLFRTLLQGMLIPNVTFCVRAEAFAAVGGYHETLACYEDWWLVLRLARNGTFFADSAIGARIGHRPESLSATSVGTRRTMSPAMFRDAIRLVREVWKSGFFPRDDVKFLGKVVETFCATNVAAYLRARFWRESAVILKGIAGEAVRSPLLCLKILTGVGHRLLMMGLRKARPF